MTDATTTTANNISAPCGMTNEMPNDAELQNAYARLDKHMCYFLWQDAWKQPTASAYVDQLLKEVPNAISDPLKGRLACVTGVKIGGAGYYVAEELAVSLKMDVVLLGRSPTKLQAAADSIKAKQDAQDANHANKIYQVPFDLDDLTTAVSASKQIKDIAEEYDNALHILVNNAGANIPDRQLTKQNIEVNTGRNFVAPHKLTAELMPLLRTAADVSDTKFVPRVVFVASIGHISGTDFDVKRFLKHPDEGGCPEKLMSKESLEEGVDPLKKSYRQGNFVGGTAMYMYAKFAAIASTYAWAKHEPKVAFYSLQPGSIASNFGSNAHWLLNFLYYKVFAMFQFSPSQGAVSTLRACLDPTLVAAHRNGAYLDANGTPCMPRLPITGQNIYELGEEIYSTTNKLCDQLL